MTDPLSPLGSSAKLLWLDLALPDCFVAAAEEQFFPVVDLDDGPGADDLVRSAH